MDTVAAQFMSILEKERTKELKPFLQSLSDAQKKELAPVLKKIAKDYMGYEAIQKGNTTTYKEKAKDGQKDIIRITAFVCLSLADFDRVDTADWILQKEKLKNVIDWYCPDWFNDLVNRQAEKEYLAHLNYDWIMELTEMGFLRPSRELVVKALPDLLYEIGHPKSYHRPERLLQRSITLDEHIWWLFELESSINWSGRYLQIEGTAPVEERNWAATLKKFTSEGRISRQRLLRSSLLASNRNFDKNLSGWFTELFLMLAPDYTEILTLQNDLIGVLGAPHSRPVNAALGCLKQIADDERFATGDFLHRVPALLASETKNVITATMGLMEKLAKKDVGDRRVICELMTQVFIHCDEQLQVKAARIIDKHRAALDGSFFEALQPYEASLLSPAKAILGEWVKPVTGLIMEDTPAPAAEENIYAEIPPVTKMDDIVFLASQAFDNNQPWHIELLPALLVSSIHLLTGKQIAMLAPALQRALKLVKNGMQMNQGHLDDMLAIFFIDVCILLTRREPASSAGLIQLFEKFNENEDENFRADPDKDLMYTPHRRILLAALDKIKKNDRLPLLSTPTHEPGWIDPGILIERLASYQRAGRDPEATDLQIAVSRVLRPRTAEEMVQYAALAQAQLSGEWQHLILFVIGAENEPVGPHVHADAWLCAALTRPDKRIYPGWIKGADHQRPILVRPYLGSYAWETIVRDETYKKYDYNLKKEVEMGRQHKVLRVKLYTGEKVDRSSMPALFYDHFRIKKYFNEHNDVRRILFLSPHNPEPMLAQIIYYCLADADFYEADDRKIVTIGIQTLYEIWNGAGDMSYLFLGTCFLSSDKTIAGIAAEIWLKESVKGTMDNEKLGMVIGTHESVEFAPLKRLTDLMTQKLFRISSFHDRQLQMLISHILPYVSGKPVKGLKKLMEIYTELSSA